ncbi:hypothetical protein EPUL_004540, partial [Erysiphe pulchra]
MSYSGPLYSQTMNLYTWPLHYERLIKKGKNKLKEGMWEKAVYQLVFSEHGEAIDILVRIANSDLAKCWRIENSQPIDQFYEMDQSTGYQCGQKFIPNEDIFYIFDIAKTFIGKGRDFPAPYTGHLYNPEGGFLIWPIYRGRAFYKYGTGPTGPYYIVMDSFGRFQDVIVKTMKQQSFVRCIRARNDLSSLYSDADSSTAEQTVFSGFTCNHVFFSDNYLETAQKLAALSKKNLNPKMHYGYPCDSPCFLLPVRPHGTPYRPGRGTQYLLVLGLDYKIMGVVMMNLNMIKKCERKTIGDGDSNHDKNAYHCGDTLFTNDELLATAKVACLKKKSYDIIYPQHYDGEIFDVEGPYQIYPLKKGKNFKTVVGALTKELDTQQLVKCSPIIGLSGGSQLKYQNINPLGNTNPKDNTHPIGNTHSMGNTY